MHLCEICQLCLSREDSLKRHLKLIHRKDIGFNELVKIESANEPKNQYLPQTQRNSTESMSTGYPNLGAEKSNYFGNSASLLDIERVKNGNYKVKDERKMKLVDFNLLNHGKPNTSEAVTNAIKTLANASEFNRAYFGQNTITISQLNNELQALLGRTDLHPDTQLKLYSQSLARYLFLQRESTNPVQAPGNVIIQPPASTHQSTGLSSTTSGRTSPTVSEPESMITVVSGKPGHSRVTPRNSHVKDVLQGSRIPKYKSHLPRSTPKADILRQNRTEKRMSDFFYGWENSL